CRTQRAVALSEPSHSAGRRPQGSRRREITSLSRRSPADSPALASSPTISTAEETSSAPPGGRTGPLARSAAGSKSGLGAEACLGDERRAPRACVPRGFAGPVVARRLGALAPLRADSAGLPLRAGAVRDSARAVPARAAARRGLER